jgi:hypothetical protein
MSNPDTTKDESPTGVLPDLVSIALRAYTVPAIDDTVQTPQRKPRRQGARGPTVPEGERILVIDFETELTTAQRLTFGWFGYYNARRSRAGKVTLQQIDEGLVYADDLEARDPDGFARLRRYAQHHRPNVDPIVIDAPTSIRFVSEHEMRGILYRYCYRDRATLVGFNVNYDASRLAMDWGASASPKFAGGFSLALFDLADGVTENRYRPRLNIKHLDSRRALRGFTTPHKMDADNREADGRPFAGHILDLRTPVFALTDRGHTLRSAGEAMGAKIIKTDAEEHGKITLDYIGYARHDVQATASLYEAAITEYNRHPVKDRPRPGNPSPPLQPTKCFSPASIGKGYLRAMGIKPPMVKNPDFPAEILGYAAAAYVGGRTEARIRGRVPVVYCDAASMYPTVNALMNTWVHVIASRIEPRPVTRQVRALVDAATVEAWLKPELWPRLTTLVQVAPSHDDVFPVRARYGNGRSWNIGINPVQSSEPLWLALPDVISSKIITGNTPRILKSVQLVPVSMQRGLRPVKLRGEVEVDPRHEDFFKACIERRRKLPDRNSPLGTLTKCLANSCGYGIFAEVVRQDQPGGERASVTVHDHAGSSYVANVTAPERPGEFAFMPLAATITAAARLMLALFEALITKAGGTFATADTDSLMPVATEHGGLVPVVGGPYLDQDGRECVTALSWAQLDEILARFEDLNPYDPAIVPGSIIEIEPENYALDPTKPGGVDRRRRQQLYCDAISAKRYQLTNDAGETLKTVDDLDRDAPGDQPDEGPDGELPRKLSRHGIGLYMNPTDPESESDDLTADAWRYITHSVEPDWIDRPALTRTTITTPLLLRPFHEYNEERPPGQRIRPYNFILVAHPHRFLLEDPERFLLIARYEPDPRKWRSLDWRNAYDPDGTPLRIYWDAHPESTEPPAHFPGTIRVRTWREILDEYKTHPEPKSLGPDGLPCHRRTIGLLRRRPITVATIHNIGRETNMLEDAYHHGQPMQITDLTPQDPLWTLTLQTLALHSDRDTAAAAHVSHHTLTRARQGHPIRQDARQRLTDHASRTALQALRAAGITPPVEPEARLATHLAHGTGTGAGANTEHSPAQLCEGCGKPIEPNPHRRGPAPRHHGPACRKRAARRRAAATAS